jgi:AraC-like DNA-binding protein
LQKRDRAVVHRSVVRKAPGPARGVLSKSAPDGTIEHRRLLPSSELADRIAHFWWIRWQLRSAHRAETLSHPTVHVVFETPGRAEIAGVPTRRFVRTLEGEGRVFGIKFRPAMFREVLGRSVATIRDRVLPFAEVFGDSKIARQLAKARDLEAAITLAEPFLQAELQPPAPGAIVLRDLVERIERDSAILRVADAAALVGLEPRTLERRFADFIGASPKWVIRRYRLIEAAERLKAGGGTVAELAVSLGYFDQAHFTRDFKAIVGTSPSAFKTG